MAQLISVSKIVVIVMVLASINLFQVFFMIKEKDNFFPFFLSLVQSETLVLPQYFSQKLSFWIFE